jgi:hypothetical protein
VPRNNSTEPGGEPPVNDENQIIPDLVPSVTPEVQPPPGGTLHDLKTFQPSNNPLGKPPTAAQVQQAQEGQQAVQDPQVRQLESLTGYRVLIAGIARTGTSDGKGGTVYGDPYMKGDIVGADAWSDQRRLELISMGALEPIFGGPVPDAGRFS